MARLPEDARIGTVLADRYRIDALIGEGGMGRVYSAEHVLMKKRLAVKILRRELTTVPEVVARFEREAMAAANIDHPNVAAATDFGKLPDGAVFLVLEFVLGISLRDEIANGPLPVERALHIARQIAAGLASAHAQGIVHRDLKPENVMLVERAGDKDFVKVLDFGIAKVPIGDLHVDKDQPITRAGMVFGTPEYMSPEQALGQGVDGRADLYSLGVILFEMLAGTRPFSSANPVGILGQQLASPPPSVGERAAGLRIPPSVEQIVAKLLSRDRDQRFARAPLLVAALDALLMPAPGRAGYRFTLADGSPDEPPEAEVDDDAITRAVPPTTTAVRDEPSAPPIAPQSQPLPRESARPSMRARIASVMPPAEAIRERLPQRLRESLRPIPTRTLAFAAIGIGLVVTALLVAIAVGVARARSHGDVAIAAPAASAAPVLTATPSSAAPPSSAASAASSGAPTVPSDRALPAEIEVAQRQGAPALEVLSTQYPLDARPLVEAARAWLAAKDYVRATGAAGRALALDSEVAHDEKLAWVLFQTAQMRASADAAFALLEGPMADRGAQALWDLAADERVQPWARQRAGQWLRSPAFRRVAPPSLLLAADLRTAASCDAAHALLSKAISVGDRRSLAQLQAWTKRTGCGKRKSDDCMPCLRKDSALDDAIAAIEHRTQATK